MILWNSKSEVMNLSPRTCRPKAKNPKNNDVKVRLDDETNNNLNNYCTKHRITKAEAIRRGICLLLAGQK